MDTKSKLQLLDRKLEYLENRQNAIFEEYKTVLNDIKNLKADLDEASVDISKKANSNPKIDKQEQTKDENSRIVQNSVVENVSSIKFQKQNEPIVAKDVNEDKSTENRVERNDERNSTYFNFESLIGENILNKIGILITIIGVALGIKYAVDKELISPVVRLLLGYLFGAVLFAVAMKLKKNYDNFSAVLLSGAMAIAYFVTYWGYSLLGVYNNLFCYLLMVAITIATVSFSIKLNKQVISIIGLVGAYAIPFMLSEDSNKFIALFTYISIVNVGILYVAIKKYWKSLYYISFGYTWLIVLYWVLSSYNSELVGQISIFLTLFYITFYAMFIIHKLLLRKNYKAQDVVLLLLNTTSYFSLMYFVLRESVFASQFLGIFTIAIAGLNFVVAKLLLSSNVKDKNIYHLIVGISILFLTLFISIQFDGNWVTIMWVGQACVLFTVGRQRFSFFYEKLSYPVLFISVISLLQDWIVGYHSSSPNSIELFPIMNQYFLNSLLFVIVVGLMCYIDKKYKSDHSIQVNSKLVTFLFVTIFLSTVYFGIFLEIYNYWEQQIRFSINEFGVNSIERYGSEKFQLLWIVNYSIIFSSILCGINYFKLRSKVLDFICLVIFGFTYFLFLTEIQQSFTVMRDWYLESEAQLGMIYISIRYISIVIFICSLFIFNRLLRKRLIDFKLDRLIEVSFHVIVIWLLSTEIIYLIKLFNFSFGNKILLTILWVMYSIFLIINGIKTNKSYLRIGALGLMAISLLKLFFYDIQNLDNFAKTIVFVVVGVLMLIASFLYNKFKDTINS
jgi:hypothetical protein